MKGHHHQDLVRVAQGLERLLTAVIHVVDEVSLAGAGEAAKQKLIIPVLVGPSVKSVSRQSGLSSMSPTTSLCSPSTATPRRSRLSRLAHDHKVEALLMKGSLHTDEYMGTIVGEEKRAARRMRHVFTVECPEAPNRCA